MTHRKHDPGPSRRDLLRGAALGGLGLLGIPRLSRALGAEPTPGSGDEFFIFIHAAGGWDVTLWSDPRNERAGLVEPATTATVDAGAMRLWKDASTSGERSFEIVQPSGCKIPFGPGIGHLVDHFDRLLVVNGLAMNTVSHPDGIAFSATGRHLQGSRAPQPSLNTVIANEYGLSQTFPSISVQFPSSYVGEQLDRRAAPLSIERIGNLATTLRRSAAYETAADREAISVVLSEEAAELAARAHAPGVLEGFALQLSSLGRMVRGGLEELFSDAKLRQLQPQLNYRSRYHGPQAVNAAFAIEACKRNLVRCISFSLGGLDTHGASYRSHGAVQQDLFDLVAELLRALDRAPHPTRTGHKLSEHTHVLVLSEFCRTPQLNLAGGRDHYPNNSALVISPRFPGNRVFGRTDPEQLLPAATLQRGGAARPIEPPDLLATFLGAFGVAPRKYLRDGEVVQELLRS